MRRWILVVLLLLGLTGTGTAGALIWHTSDVRLDTIPPATTNPGAAVVTDDGNGNVYAAWSDSRAGQSDIYFNRSSDSGQTWLTNEIRIDRDAPAPGWSYIPQISVDQNGHIFVVWQDDRNGTYDIYLNRSSDYGATWQASDIRLDTDSPGNAWSYRQQISQDGNGNVYVVWEDLRNGRTDIYFNHSSDFGATWQSTDTMLSTDSPGAAWSSFPLISSDGNGNVYVVWQDQRNGNEDIYFNFSSDFGATWQASDIRLDTDSPGAGWSFSQQISSDGNGNVYVVWQDQRNTSANIYFNHSSDFGATWQTTDTRIDNITGSGGAFEPYLKSDKNGNVYVAWSDSRNGMDEIYFNRSADFGATWQSSDTKVSNSQTYDSDSPIISGDENGNVYMVWEGISSDDPQDVFFNHSSDHGATWQTKSIKVNDADPFTVYAYDPQMSIDEAGNVYIVWHENSAVFFDGGHLDLAAAEIPTLSEWGMLAMVVGFLIIGATYMRKRAGRRLTA